MSDPTHVHTNAYEVLDALYTARHSCRRFLPQPVPRESITRILSLAQKTASWCNSQPWQVDVLSGAVAQRFTTGLAEQRRTGEPKTDIPWPREYVGSYLARRRECGFALYEAVGVRGDRVASAKQSEQNFELFGAPHVALISTPEALGTYGAVDCGAYVGNFQLIARSLGVACIAQAALATIRRSCANSWASAKIVW